MAHKKPTLEQILEHASPQAKDAFAYIDQGFAAGIGWDTILNGVLSVFEGNDEVVEASKAYMETKYPEKEPRSQEDIPEFGDLDDDNDNEEESDNEFERLLNDFIKTELNSDDDTDNEDIEAIVWPGDYRLHCGVNNSEAERPVEGVIRHIAPAARQFLHIDIELPDINENGELHVTVGMANRAPKVNAWFDKNSISLFRDGNRLHVAPIAVTSLLEPDGTIPSGETAYVNIKLCRNDKEVGEFSVGIDGPWPLTEHNHDVNDNMETISRYQGWDNFKARMEAMRIRCEVDGVREKIGLTQNRPRLHTAIIGNAGTGKTTAVELMAKLYKALGLLKTDQIWTTRVSTLATSSINSENEAVENAVISAQGGTLVIDRAHELFRTDKPSYDTEGRIIRALVDALNNTGRYENWMLVLAGEPEGMEYLLSTYPELKKCLTEPIYLEDFKPDELFSMFDLCCEQRGLKLSEDARKKLQMYIFHKYNHRGTAFQNALLVQNLFDDEIIPAM